MKNLNLIPSSQEWKNISKEIAENDRQIMLNKKLSSLLISAGMFALSISVLLLTLNF